MSSACAPRTSPTAPSWPPTSSTATAACSARKVELNVVDDACDAGVAYEAAKAFLSDGSGQTAGVIGGMCDEAAEREVPVIDSTGIPFLVTSATQTAWPPRTSSRRS